MLVPRTNGFIKTVALQNKTPKNRKPEPKPQTTVVLFFVVMHVCSLFCKAAIRNLTKHCF